MFFPGQQDHGGFVLYCGMPPPPMGFALTTALQQLTPLPMLSLVNTPSPVTSVPAAAGQKFFEHAAPAVAAGPATPATEEPADHREQEA